MCLILNNCLTPAYGATTSSIWFVPLDYLRLCWTTGFGTALGIHRLATAKRITRQLNFHFVRYSCWDDPFLFLGEFKLLTSLLTKIAFLSFLDCSFIAMMTQFVFKLLFYFLVSNLTSFVKLAKPLVSYFKRIVSQSKGPSAKCLFSQAY